jgi:hypothetical protein
MIDGFLLVGAISAYLFGAYKIAFWVAVFAIANGFLAILRTVAQPEWYIRKRIEAGLDPVLDIKGLLVAKAVVLVPLCVAVWYFGGRAGYW